MIVGQIQTKILNNGWFKHRSLHPDVIAYHIWLDPNRFAVITTGSGSVDNRVDSLRAIVTRQTGDGNRANGRFRCSKVAVPREGYRV
jgi:hypothetical protein